MKKYPLTPMMRRVCRPELRMEAKGSVGLYPRRGAGEPLGVLHFDWKLAAPLVKAIGVALALVALVELFDD